MIKNSRLLYLTLIIMLSLVTFTGIALAADDENEISLDVEMFIYNPDAEGDKVKLDPVTDAETGDTVYYSYSNLIFLYIDHDGDEVTVNKRVIPDGGNETSVILSKIGENTITIKVDTEDGVSVTKNLKVYYYNNATPANNTSFFLKMPSSGTITNVFDGSIKLYFPKNTYVMDKYGPAASQYIMMIAKKDPSDGLENGDTYKSPNALAFEVWPVTIDEEGFKVNYEYELSSEGTITLTYDNNQVLRPEILTVYYYKGEWENIGGKVDTRKYTISAPFKGFGEYIVAQRSNNFSEFDKKGEENFTVSWAKLYIDVLYAKGIIEPKINADKGSFGLVNNNNGEQTPATRLEFSKAIVKGLGLNIETDEERPKGLDGYAKGDGNSFTDDEKKIMNTAFINGILQGTVEDGKRYFDGNGFLTRAQAAVVLARVLELKLEMDEEKVRSQLQRTFGDNTNIEAWAAPAALAVSKAKIFTDKNFRPGEELTYAEMSKIVYIMLQRAGKL
ncbi:S-layer homology domain-containing protein [Desulfolucanica intricata]|uniref:S-layer homology domain-containing protein n=1 Tax=Desulfolucanica intricata TaxID=1285191 RepID=UPI000835589A|nr:S-layer homology domain-containing protein [Desulfolucanica intricata]